MRFPKLALGAAVALSAAALASAACSSSDDAKPKGEARPDASSAADGGDTSEAGPSGASFCATLTPAPFFCADFDDGAAADQVFNTVSGAVKVEDRSLHIVADGTDVFVEHDTDPSPHWERIELAFALRIDATAKNTRGVIARIGQHQTDAECRLELELAEGGIALTGTGATAAALTKPIASGTTARFVLTLDAAGDGGGLRGMVTVDGQPAVAAPMVLGCASFPGPPRVSLGRVNGAGAADLRFDDVVFDGR